jgi:hypothetical protein
MIRAYGKIGRGVNCAPLTERSGHRKIAVRFSDDPAETWLAPTVNSDSIHAGYS